MSTPTMLDVKLFIRACTADQLTEIQDSFNARRLVLDGEARRQGRGAQPERDEVDGGRFAAPAAVKTQAGKLKPGQTIVCNDSKQRVVKRRLRGLSPGFIVIVFNDDTQSSYSTSHEVSVVPETQL